MDSQLAGKSVVITGGGSNIGRAIVHAFAEEGAKITIGDIDDAQAAKVAKEAKSMGAQDAQVVKTDVTDLASCKAMIAAAVSKFGTVDSLVNNVGWDDLMFFMQTTPEFWDKVIKINYLSVINCTRSVLEVMVEKQQGSIVSISSDASRQGEPREAVYGGCKAAVNSFMKTIAKENGRYGIRCNVVCPGVTPALPEEEVGDTSMWADKEKLFTPEQFKKISASLPLRKVGTGRDIANAAVFLSSNNLAGHVTGQVLSASGGYSMVG